MSKPDVVAYISDRGLQVLKRAGRSQYPVSIPGTEKVSHALIRLTDHESAMKTERQIGFSAAFDVLTWRSANTDNEILAEELDDLAHELLESAPDWQDRWKQIHKMNQERAADKARIAELESALTELRDWYQDHTGLPACRANATLAHQALDACRSGGMKTPSCNYGD